jgi:hypothetical protein
MAAAWSDTIFIRRPNSGAGNMISVDRFAVATENEFIGEEAGPLEHRLATRDHAELVTFITEAQKRYEISDRALLGRAEVSPHTLRGFRGGKRISDKSLIRLVRAAEQNERWLEKLRQLRDKLGGRNKEVARRIWTTA